MLGPPLSPSFALKPPYDSHCHCRYLSLSLTHHPSSPQPLTFKPTPLDIHSEKLGNRILAFPLGECYTSQLKALKLTMRSLPT